MLFKWLRLRRAKPQPAPIRTEVIEISHGITLAIWQSRTESVKWAREFYQTREGIDMLSVIRNELPFHLKGNSSDYSLGVINGYLQAIDVLASLALYPQRMPENIPVTYEQPTDEQDSEQSN